MICGIDLSLTIVSIVPIAYTFINLKTLVCLPMFEHLFGLVAFFLYFCSMASRSYYSIQTEKVKPYADSKCWSIGMLFALAAFTLGFPGLIISVKYYVDGQVEYCRKESSTVNIEHGFIFAWVLLIMILIGLFLSVKIKRMFSSEDLEEDAERVKINPKTKNESRAETQSGPGLTQNFETIQPTKNSDQETNLISAPNL